MSRNIPFISGRLFARVAAPAIGALMLASCQTTAQDSAAPGDAIPTEAAGNTPTKPAPAKKATGVYTDPLVASAAGSSNRQVNPPVSSGDGSLAAYAPSQTPSDLGELTMQATSVNASRNSLFSPAPVVAEESLGAPPANTPATTPADTEAMALAENGRGTSTSIVVPSELPTRQVNPMSKSLFSAELRQPRPAVIEEAALPAASSGEPPVYAAGELPVYDNPASAAQPVVENERQAAEAAEATAVDAEPEQPKKRTWLTSLKAMIGQKKD